MRLWSFHPKYLDARGLTALWREGLLARQVLLGNTTGYRHHPQLIRFSQCPNPINTLDAYLKTVFDEATRRHYLFNAQKINLSAQACQPIEVTTGQLAFEWQHFRQKVKTRNPACYSEIATIPMPEPHPLFQLTVGPVEAWEKGNRATPSL